MSTPRWKPESREALTAALEKAGSISGAARIIGCAVSSIRDWAADNGFDLSPFSDGHGNGIRTSVWMCPKCRRVFG